MENTEKKSPLIEVDKALVTRIIVGYVASHVDGKCSLPDILNGPKQCRKIVLSDYLSKSEIKSAKDAGVALRKKKDKEAKAYQKKMALAMKMQQEEAGEE